MPLQAVFSKFAFVFIRKVIVMNHIFIEFASPLLLILKGLLVGIIASAPMGPVGILCIQRTMQKGRAYGIVTGAGASLSDIIYALMTGFGMSFVMDFISNEENIFLAEVGGQRYAVYLWHIYVQNRSKGIHAQAFGRKRHVGA